MIVCGECNVRHGKTRRNYVRKRMIGSANIIDVTKLQNTLIVAREKSQIRPISFDEKTATSTKTNT